MEEKLSKSPERLFDLDRKSDEPPSALGNLAPPHLVCLAGSGRSLSQLREILTDFTSPENVAWVVLNFWDMSNCNNAFDHFGTVAAALSGTQVSMEFVVSIKEGSCEPLVARKVYVVHPECTLLLTPEQNILGLRDKPQNCLWLEDCAIALAVGSPHHLRVALLSSAKSPAFTPPVLEWFDSVGAEFFTPLFTPYHKPGQGHPYEHFGGLTDHLVGVPIPYKSAALNELTAAIIKSIGEED